VTPGANGYSVFLYPSPNWSYWNYPVLAGINVTNLSNDLNIVFQLTSDATFISYTSPTATYSVSGLQVTLRNFGQNLDVSPLAGVAGVYKTSTDAATPLIFANVTYGGSLILQPPFIWLVKPAPSSSSPYPSGCSSGLDLMQCNQPTGHWGWIDGSYNMNLAAKYKLQVEGALTSCSVNPGVDWVGNDITSFSSPSVDDCQIQCDSLPACVCYQWGGNTCFLKRTCTGNSSPTTIGTGGLCPKSSISSCISKPNTDWGGNDITMITRASAALCCCLLGHIWMSMLCMGLNWK